MLYSTRNVQFTFFFLHKYTSEWTSNNIISCCKSYLQLCSLKTGTAEISWEFYRFYVYTTGLFFLFFVFFEKFNSKGLDFLLKNWIIKLYFHLLTFIYRNFRKHFGDTDIFFCKSTGETYNYWWYFTRHERLIKLNGIFNQIFVMEIVFWLFKIL